MPEDVSFRLGAMFSCERVLLFAQFGSLLSCNRIKTPSQIDVEKTMKRWQVVVRVDVYWLDRPWMTDWAGLEQPPR